MIGKKLKTLEEKVIKRKKNIRNDLKERRTRIGNSRTKNRRVEQKRQNRQSIEPIQ